MSAVLEPRGLVAKAFEPLLAKPVEFKHLDYTNLWLSPKLDGIRCIVRDGVVVSRKLKPIPNQHVQNLFGGRSELEGYDGELIVGPVNAPDVYLRTNSGVMSRDGEPEVMLYAFDHILHPTNEYWKRYDCLRDHRGVMKLNQHPIETEHDILDLEEYYLGLGYEGVMLRAFQGPRSFYKYGRSTAREGTLLKLKRFEDFDAYCYGIEEEMFNGNEATKDELGRTKRSSHQENKVGKGTMGVMLMRTAEGVEFRVGIFKGYDAAWKQAVWNDPSMVVDRWWKVQKFAHGEKDKPRHPKILGPRDAMDM